MTIIEAINLLKQDSKNLAMWRPYFRNVRGQPISIYSIFKEDSSDLWWTWKENLVQEPSRFGVEDLTANDWEIGNRREYYNFLNNIEAAYEQIPKKAEEKFMFT